MVLGICMDTFNKIIKQISSNDTLILYVKEDNLNCLGIQFENKEQNTITDYKLNLVDMFEENIKIPSVTFDIVISIPSCDFQKRIIDMSIVGKNIEIKSCKNKIIFSCTWKNTSQETILDEKTDKFNYKTKTDNDTEIKGVYNIKRLLLINKFSKVSRDIENLFTKWLSSNIKL